jgi:proteasome lid subunit RPN8/RPN11
MVEHHADVVTLGPDVVDRVVLHARQAAPAECCGLLLGNGSRIVDATPTRNVADNPTRFLIDAKDHIDGRRAARGRGLDVVGFYHSHPQSPAQPSARDRDEASYPDHYYLIVSLLADPPEVRVFIPGDGTFREAVVGIE